jgi:hypothetical protein
VYGRTGRVDAARQMYAEVMTRPAVSMLTPSGAAVSSHDLAQRGMARISPAVLATR